MKTLQFYFKNTHLRKTVGTSLQRGQAAVIIVTLCLYGSVLAIWKKLVSVSGFSRYLQDDYYLWLLQGTLAAFFPEVMPFVFFGIYTFAYRVELVFGVLKANRELRKQVISYIQRLRKSRIGLASFIGRVGAFGFTGGLPKMPGGNPQGMVVWGVVVVSSVALNQYRLYRKDKMLSENERLRDAQQGENERIRDTLRAENEQMRNRQQAQTEAYKAHTEAINKRPWFGSKPPEPPKF